MNKFITSAFFISALVISGCSTSGNQHLKNETSQSLQSKIIKNKTTKSEIITALGEPETKTTLDSGNEEWTYSMDNNQFDAHFIYSPCWAADGGLTDAGQNA